MNNDNIICYNMIYISYYNHRHDMIIISMIYDINDNIYGKYRK